MAGFTSYEVPSLVAACGWGGLRLGAACFVAPGVLVLVLTGSCVELGSGVRRFSIVKMVILSMDSRNVSQNPNCLLSNDVSCFTSKISWNLHGSLVSSVFLYTFFT